MSSKPFKSFVAALSVSFLTTIACNPIASSPAAVNRPLFTEEALPTAKSTPPVASAQRDQTKAVSGAYGALLLGIGYGGEITGYYSNSTGAGQYNCNFYVLGKLQNGIAEITTWFPKDKEIIGGRLEFVEEGGTPGVNIKLAEEPGGCGMTDPELDDETGSTHLLDESGNGVRYALYPSPNPFFIVVRTLRRSKKPSWSNTMRCACTNCKTAG